MTDSFPIFFESTQKPPVSFCIHSHVLIWVRTSIKERYQKPAAVIRYEEIPMHIPAVRANEKVTMVTALGKPAQPLSHKSGFSVSGFITGLNANPLHRWM